MSHTHALALAPLYPQLQALSSLASPIEMEVEFDRAMAMLKDGDVSGANGGGPGAAAAWPRGSGLGAWQQP